MRVERKQLEFNPVTITLESDKEVSAIVCLLQHVSILGRKEEHPFYTYSMCLRENLENELVRILDEWIRPNR